MTPDQAPEPTGGPKLDLSLFRLPIFPQPDNVVVPVSARPSRTDRVKHDFWATIARRVDLTGSNSPVKVMPYGTGHDRPLAIEIRANALYEQLRQKAEAVVLLDENRTHPLNLHRSVALAIQEVTPQFFLRNIVRLTRDVNVRRPNYRFAVWREDAEDYFEAVRNPRIEPPELIEAFTPSIMADMRRELLANVLGFEWESNLLEIPPAPRRLHPFQFAVREYIPIGELSLKPAPPMRFDPDRAHRQTMAQIGKRFDGTADREKE